MHIMKALAARSNAIKRALQRYNKVAAQLDPPAPSISWDEIVNVSVLADFDLLRGSRRRVLEQEWARPENRRCVEQFHRLLRAEEEIMRLNVEVRRVRTFISDEALVLATMPDEIAKHDASLRWVAERYASRRLKINQLISHQLDLIEQIPGYSGRPGVGVRVGHCQVSGMYSLTMLAYNFL